MIKFTRMLQLCTCFLLLLEIYIPDVWIDFHFIALIISIPIILNASRCRCIIIKYHYALVGLFFLKFFLFQTTFLFALIWCAYFVGVIYLALMIFFISFKVVF